MSGLICDKEDLQDDGSSASRQMMFSTACPDAFTSFTGAQGVPAVICEKHSGASGGSNNPTILWQIPIRLRLLRLHWKTQRTFWNVSY